MADKTASPRGMPGIQLPQDPVPTRIYVPASVAYDLVKLQKTLANLAEKIGHPGCHSGRPLEIFTEREFFVDEKTLRVGSLGDLGRFEREG